MQTFRTGESTTEVHDLPARVLKRHPLQFRELRVIAITELTPRSRRVVLAGAALEGFVSLAADDHVKVFFPAESAAEPVVPRVVGERVEWPAERGAIIARDYTPVHFDAEALTLELHIVLHGGGQAARWAQRARVGDVLVVAGPRGSLAFSHPPERLLMVGDETALPAMARWLHELPATSRVCAVVDVLDQSAVRPLSCLARCEVRWVVRTHESDVDSLLALVRALSLPSGLWNWVAGEAHMVQAVRRILVVEKEVPAAAITARGYWKRGSVDHQEPHDD